ncbi:MAG: ClbS/DfsB family four-helix bundle protein, partial [Chloroflexota bacterium]|nr:ClbS/DfsB family four-helix bundle protein [Chloroflexota bacterium]
MPQPKSKAQIMKRLQTERKRLEQNLTCLSRDEMLQPGVVGESSVKDVLAHLADWEARMPVWIQAARSGDRVESPEPGLSWKQLDI